MTTSTTSHSDALVFFGATGDLAFKKIFPALQAGAPVHEYEPNRWGPSEVEQQVSPPGRRRNPVVTG